MIVKGCSYISFTMLYRRLFAGTGIEIPMDLAYMSRCFYLALLLYMVNVLAFKKSSSRVHIATF